MTAKSVMANLREQNTSLVAPASPVRQTLPEPTPKPIIHHNSLFDGGFLTEKNIYFLVFVSIAMLITGSITFIRRRQHKLQQHRKEQDYLRYFHSVLPHSQIYGNLNDTFAKDRRKNSRKASMKNKKSGGSSAPQTEHIRRVSVTSISSAVNGVLKRFQYQQPTKKTVSLDPDEDEDECKSIEDMSTNIDIESHRNQSIHEAEATVHSVLNNKFNSNMSDIEDMKTNDITTAENVCQKFYFPTATENRAGVLNSPVKDMKHEPSSPRVRFSTEKDEIMQGDGRVSEDTLTAAESEKSDIADGGNRANVTDKHYPENISKIPHKGNGFINLMQRIAERNNSQVQSAHTQRQPDVAYTCLINEKETNDKESDKENDIASPTEQKVSKSYSENAIQGSGISNTTKLNPIKKSTSFLQMERCKRDQEMLCKKYDFMFEDSSSQSDVQVTVL